MSDDTRIALGIPIVVQTVEGAVEVRPLSAVEFIVLCDQVVGIGKLVREDAAKGDLFSALQRVLARHPTAITGLLSTSTGLSAQKLGALPLDEFLDLTIAFIDQHERSIQRFFDLKRRWEDLTQKTRPSRNSSTVSSAVAGPSPTSEKEASTNSNSTEGSPPFEESAITSSN